MFPLFIPILAAQVAQAAPLFTRQALTPDLTVVKVIIPFLYVPLRLMWLIVVRSPC
jgi:hypothetical protein